MKRKLAFIAMAVFVSASAFALEPSGWTKRFYLGLDFSQQWAYYRPAYRDCIGATDMRGNLIIGFSSGDPCKCPGGRVELVLGAGQLYQNPIAGVALLKIVQGFETKRFFCGPLLELGCCFDKEDVSVVFNAGVQIGWHLAEHWTFTAEAKIGTLNILGGGSLGTSVGILYLL